MSWGGRIQNFVCEVIMPLKEPMNGRRRTEEGAQAQAEGAVSGRADRPASCSGEGQGRREPAGRVRLGRPVEEAAGRANARCRADASLEDRGGGRELGA